MNQTVPQTVLDAFRITTDADDALGSTWDYGIRYGSRVIATVTDTVRARYSADIRDTITPDGIRFAKPITSTDGRTHVNGWKCTDYTPGPRATNIDDLVTIGLRLDDALSNTELPKFTHDRITAPWDTADIYRVADTAAWSHNPSAVLAPGLDLESEPSPALHWALTMAKTLTDAMDEEVLSLNPQPCHADLIGTTIAPAGQPPVITDFVCVARPYGYTSILAIADGLIAEVIDDGIIARHHYIPHCKQMLLRALLYRVFVHALHPDATAEMRTHIERVAHLVTSSN
ncbi:TIGR02569 family protein [Corynebacterium aquilae]|uniref:TIGR02569 family protein n=1 Tax=Corynebacterium aquilae TaxID=203263 RepID=UPI000950CCD7|nr:TIGR02569 family protein [Corynebacterium aquilae]